MGDDQRRSLEATEIEIHSLIRTFRGTLGALKGLQRGRDPLADRRVCNPLSTSDGVQTRQTRVRHLGLWVYKRDLGLGRL